MEVKIDTKEKFHVITPIVSELSATMADQIDKILLPFLQENIKNVVLNLEQVQHMDKAIAEQLIHIQQQFYENNASFVCCALGEALEAFLADCELLELLNVTPTVSEAGDIVNMEEIERELLDSDFSE